VSAAKRFIGSAGIRICGMVVLISARTGIVRASSLGNSGKLRIAKLHSCVASKGDAAGKPADGCGGMLR
jgi:hypothetical protein